MATLAFEGVSVELGGRRVVDGFSAVVAAAEWVTLIGPNGAGKTTVLRAAAGHVGYSGSLRVAGREVRELPARQRAREIAVVPQEPVTPPALAVVDYVMLGRTPYVPYFGREGSSDHAAVERALGRLELGALADRPLGSLSGGERQRAVLARALAQEAPVLLLDEPTSALDIGRQQTALELVDCLRADLGLTVVSAMHDLTIAGQYADRLVLLSAGLVAAEGAPGDVLTAPRIAEHYHAHVAVLASGDGPPAVVPRRVASEAVEARCRP
jgi:iron complex transport system ATP-binding protein